MEVNKTLSYWWKPRCRGCGILPIPTIGKTPFEILPQQAVRHNFFPCAAKGEVKWPIPLHLECYLQGELHLDHGKLTILIATRFSTQSESVGLGLCRAIPALSCSFLNIFLSLLLCFRMKEQEEKESGRFALAETINGKHFVFCLAIRPVQVEPLQVLPKKLVYLQFS